MLNLLFKPIQTLPDVPVLNPILIVLLNGVGTNDSMKIEFNKICSVLIFKLKKSHSKQLLKLNNSINHCSLKRINIVKYLGLLFYSKLVFSVNIYSTLKNNALSNLYFLKRKCSEFHCHDVLKTVYISIVRTYLEECAACVQRFCLLESTIRVSTK